MNDYKLVPVEPTPEMMGAARNAPMPMVLIDSIAGRQDLTNASVYRAMLAAAPDVQGEPVAVMYEDGSVLSKADCGDNFEFCCKVLTPLYTAPQPAPDVSALVEALEQVIKAAPNGGPLWHGSEQIVKARAALAAHRREPSHDNQ